jgi:hypothetical protein
MSIPDPIAIGFFLDKLEMMEQIMNIMKESEEEGEHVDFAQDRSVSEDERYGAHTIRPPRGQ